MSSHPKVHATFTVSSGGVCFGALHNIWSGSTAPIQSFPVARPQTNGTVIAHELQYNIVARNGTWNVYRLIDNRNGGVSAWYASHPSVEPVRDIRKILRVSGSPYEQDHGSTMNNEDTQREGVFVVNRYDWGYYDRRYFDEIGEGMEEGTSDVLANSNSAGLVDYLEAQCLVKEWIGMRPSKRLASKAGIWMYSPKSEYMFCRFGFDETHTATQSFIFFSSYTDFTKTTFEGLEETIRTFEAPQERFERRLAEGYNFSGVDELQKMSTLAGLRPSLTDPELKGAYKNANVIFEPKDLECLRAVSQKPRGPLHSHGFAEQWKRYTYRLLNELIWYYLDQYIRPHMSHLGGAEAMSNTIFTRLSESGVNSLDDHLYRHFTHLDPTLVSDLDIDGVSGRIKEFLVSGFHSPVSSGDIDTERVCRVVAYLIKEILELASYRASDSSHSQIVPSDIRLSIYMDGDLFHLFQNSSVFWRELE
ncbi:hypothetical protein TWF718_003272 [Orbilia javanica]|uniref:Uncharacterized protein n=1 Tax=Orbilia javanica TaxID=47235 RepID=A0AAN8MLQ5_9PEZI